MQKGFEKTSVWTQEEKENIAATMAAVAFKYGFGDHAPQNWKDDYELCLQTAGQFGASKIEIKQGPFTLTLVYEPMN